LGRVGQQKGPEKPPNRRGPEKKGERFLESAKAAKTGEKDKDRFGTKNV